MIVFFLFTCRRTSGHTSLVCKAPPKSVIASAPNNRACNSFQGVSSDARVARDSISASSARVWAVLTNFGHIIFKSSARAISNTNFECIIIIKITCALADLEGSAEIHISNASCTSKIIGTLKAIIYTV